MEISSLAYVPSDVLPWINFNSIAISLKLINFQ